MFTCAHDLQITYDREICALLGELLLRHLYAQERLHLDLDVEVHPGILEEAEADRNAYGQSRGQHRELHALATHPEDSGKLLTNAVLQDRNGKE